MLLIFLQFRAAASIKGLTGTTMGLIPTPSDQEFSGEAQYPQQMAAEASPALRGLREGLGGDGVACGVAAGGQ